MKYLGVIRIYDGDPNDTDEVTHEIGFTVVQKEGQNTLNEIVKELEGVLEKYNALGEVEEG